METATATVQFPELTAAHRCDKCNAQAFVQVLVEHFPYTDHAERTALSTTERVNTVLRFCGHDFREQELVLTAAGYQVDDQRSRINQKPSPSSA